MSFRLSPVSMFPLAFALWLAEPAPDQFNPLPAVLPAVEQTANDDYAPIYLPEPGFLHGDPRTRLHPAVGSHDSDPYSSLIHADDKRKAKTKIDANFAAITGQLSISDPEWVRNDPLRRGSSWATDETLKLPLSETLYVFGAVDAESMSVEQQQFRWLGKTGVCLKLRPWLLDEVQLRGGPALRYDDEDRPPRGYAPERSELYVEVSTKLPVPVLGAINVEYSGTAVAAVTASDRDRIKQNLKFALPLSDSSQFHVGARWHSEETPTVTPFIDRAQLYLGVQLKR